MQIKLEHSPDPLDVEKLRLSLSRHNSKQAPDLDDLQHNDFVIVLIENEQIVAGAICEIDWGWLYFETVWSHDSVRGKGYGSLVMQAAESYAKQNGINHAYLFTTSFQAQPFYEKIGYETFGNLTNRPNGHHFYYLRKYNLVESAIDSRIQIQNPPIKASVNILDNGLLNEIAKIAPLHVRKISIFLRNDDGEIVGGCVGSHFWDWFDLHLLWVDDTLQRQGWGTKLLTVLEAELHQRNINGITCDITNFQTLPFYQAQGFDSVGILKNRPLNYITTFFKKHL